MNIKWRITLSLVLTKTTDILLSAKTTLPTLLSAIGAPIWMVSFLVPLRESGSLLPQAFMATWLKTRTDRSKAWAVSLLVQIVMIVSMIFIPLLLLPQIMDSSGETYARLSATIVLVSLLCISLARAMTSLCMKDIQGKHLRKGKRGQVVGTAASVAGFLSLAFAIYSFLVGKFDEEVLLSIGLICVFAMTFSLLSLISVNTNVTAQPREECDFQGPKSRRNIDTEFWVFILVRSCFVHTALIAPFYVIWASKASFTSTSSSSSLVILSSFIFAQAMASILSSYIWGKLSDNSAKLTMQLGACIVGIACGSVIIAIYFNLTDSIPPVIFLLGYFIIAVGHEGARMGRKVYAVDIKEGANRTQFNGKTNSIIGVVIVLLGILYSLLSFVGYLALFAVMLVFIFSGLLLSAKMAKDK